jgi:putative hydrolase of the HAD superfamily
MTSTTEKPEGASLTPTRIRGVLFDLGGVVVGSPLHAIADYERELGIEPGFVSRVVVSTGKTGAWSRLECGELTLEQFYPLFDADCAASGGAFSAREMMRRVDESTVPRPEMLEAVRRLREQGLRVGALTNNWLAEEEGTRALRPHFDAFVESAVERIRKPDPRIYRIACDALGIEPPQTIFLDDIGSNLKSARALGMTTIKVEQPDAALAELEALVGFPLRS